MVWDVMFCTDLAAKPASGLFAHKEGPSGPVDHFLPLPWPHLF